MIFESAICLPPLHVLYMYEPTSATSFWKVSNIRVRPKENGPVLSATDSNQRNIKGSDTLKGRFPRMWRFGGSTSQKKYKCIASDMQVVKLREFIELIELNWWGFIEQNSRLQLKADTFWIYRLKIHIQK